MIRFLVLASLFSAALLGSTAPAAAMCKEQCTKHCMGNDTPTERAECLKREKCESQAACTGGSGLLGTSTGTMTVDPGNPPPRPQFQWQQAAPGAVLTTQ